MAQDIIMLNTEEYETTLFEEADEKGMELGVIFDKDEDECLLLGKLFSIEYNRKDKARKLSP